MASPLRLAFHSLQGHQLLCSLCCTGGHTKPNRNKGGLADCHGDRRKAAKLAFDHVFKFLCKDGLDLFLNFDSEFKWHNGSFLPSGHSMVHVRITSDGPMHWPPKFPPSVSRGFITVYCSCGTELSENDPQYALDWMSQLGTNDAHLWLLPQVYRQLGLQLDGLLIAQLPENNDGMPEMFDNVRLRPASQSDLQSDHVAEFQTGQHMKDCKAVVQQYSVDQPLVLSWTGDGSRVGSLGVQNGIAALPNNVGFCMSPQATFLFFHLKQCELDLPHAQPRDGTPVQTTQL